MDSIEIDDALLIPSGRHTLPPDEVGERQRERLLRAMVACVAGEGYASTSIANVVALARTSRSAFYEHFEDKEHCFLEVYEQMTRAFIGASLEAAAAVREWQGKLDAGISTYFDWMAKHPEVAVTTVVEVHSAGRRALEARSRALEGWMRTVEGVAVLARRSGAECSAQEADFAAIVLTSEGYVHDYARRGLVRGVAEKAPSVQALARRLFGCEDLAAGG